MLTPDIQALLHRILQGGRLAHPNGVGMWVAPGARRVAKPQSITNAVGEAAAGLQGRGLASSTFSSLMLQAQTPLEALVTEGVLCVSVHQNATRALLPVGLASC